MRADSGFWSHKTIHACRDHGVRFSITVRQVPVVREAIDAIDEDAWVTIDYTTSGQERAAETRLGELRLIVRRTHLAGPQQALFPDWGHHAFVTDRAGTAVELDACHRHHAVVGLAIRDLKHGAGLRHCPRSPDRPLAPVPPTATTAPATASNEAELTLPPPHRSGGLRSADSHASKDQSRHGSNDHAGNQERWIQV